MNKLMKKMLVLLVLLSVASACFAVTPGTSFTPRAGVGYEEARGNYYGTAAEPSYTFKSDENTGIYRKAADSIGFSTGGTERAYIDSGGLHSAGFTVYDKASTAVRSTTLNSSTITPVQTYQIIDTALDTEAINTCNVIATANITNGTIVYMQSTLASRDIIFAETNNIDMGSATRTLSDPLDLIMFLKTGTDQWVEAGFYDNN